MHVHAYATRQPGSTVYGTGSRRWDPEFMTSTVCTNTVRDALLRGKRGLTATFETPEQAAEWHGRWIEDNPRPDSCWGEDGQPARAAGKLEHTRRTLAAWSDVVDSFYSGGGEFVSLSFIPCPTRCGKYTCPEGRA
jgi:hypothetical protein